MEEKRKTVCITGASKGLGRAIAIEVARAGYDLVIHYGKDKAGALATEAEARSFGANTRLLCFDVSDRQACQDSLEEDMRTHGAYYGVVLNAGVIRDAAFPALEDEDWDQVIHTNLDGFYNVLKPIVMPMVQSRKPGRIISISSVSGIIGNRGQVNYSASKAGIIGATKALAVELAKRKITVNCVAPGAIETGMLPEHIVDEVKKVIPMGKLGKPEDIAHAVAFLLSDKASYITRQVISVNGGLV